MRHVSNGEKNSSELRRLPSRRPPSLLCSAPSLSFPLVLSSTKLRLCSPVTSPVALQTLKQSFAAAGIPPPATTSAPPLFPCSPPHLLRSFSSTQERASPMAGPNGGFQWLPNSNGSTNLRPPPSVTLTLSPSTVSNSAPPIPWLQQGRCPDAAAASASNFSLGGLPSPGEANAMIMSELAACCRDLEEGHRAWAAHKKEAAWRLKRLELQLDSEKAARRREKMEEIESKINALREERRAALERLEEEHQEQLAGLRSDAEAKEMKLAQQWATKHQQLYKLLEQIGGPSRRPAET